MESDSEEEPPPPSPPPANFPKVMYIVIPTQLLQGFSQTLMLSIKAIFMTKVLGYSENIAVMLSHVFIGCEPFSQLSGAILADSKFGKWNIIRAGCILVRIGDIFYITCVIPSLPQKELFVAAVTSTAIFNFHMPTMDAFFSEQFKLPEQEKQLRIYYNIYYWGRNVVSVAGSYAGSRLASLHCLGRNHCFAAPVWLWVIIEGLFSTTIICLGPLFVKKPPTRSVILHFVRCVAIAVKNKLTKRKNSAPKERWIDYADNQYDLEFRNNSLRLMTISYFFIISIFYWALYDQMYSRFIFQAARLDGRVSEYVNLYPGDIILVNPILVIMFLPVMEYVIYPLSRKIGILTTHLQKVATSDYLIASAFLAACILEWMIEIYDVKPPPEGRADATIYNSLSYQVVISSKLTGDLEIPPYGMKRLRNIDMGGAKKKNIFVRVIGDDMAKPDLLTLTEEKGVSFIVTEEGLTRLDGFDNYNREQFGNPLVRLISLQSSQDLVLSGGPTGNEKFYISSIPTSVPIVRGPYKLIQDTTHKVLLDNYLFDSGVFYSIALFEAENGSTTAKVYIFQENQQLMFYWILPQILILTIGEIMHSIPWRLFLYTQAPPSMRSVVFALDLIARAFGDLIVAIVAGSSLLLPKYEFLFFAILMYVVSIFFTILAIKYKTESINE